MRSRCSASTARDCSRSPSGSASASPRWGRIRGRTTSTSGSSTRALQPAARGAPLGRAAQQHVEPPRPRWGPRRRPGDRRLRPPARAAAAAPGALGELAVPRRPRNRPALRPDPDLHPHVPALRGARAVRRLGRLRRLHRPADRHGTVVEATQLWWSVRPHHSFGTVELRICDAQTRGEESFALAGLIAGCIVQAALDYDDGTAARAACAGREIEENLWRAIRYGHGRRDDRLARGRGSGRRPRAVVERLVEWTRRPAAAHRREVGCRPDRTAPSAPAAPHEDGIEPRGHLRGAVERDAAHVRA